MAVQSRSRAPRNSDSSNASTINTRHAHAATKSSSKADGKLRQSPHHQKENDNPSTTSINDTEPPAKRRKLSIRSKQTTLHGYLSSSATQPVTSQLKPPTKVTVAEPHGRLLQNLNGVQTVLDANEDELPVPPSGTATPKPKRVPKAVAIAVRPTLEPLKQSNEDKRTLRSQDDGPRLKSELAIYFPNYEDIIFDAPKEPEFITVDSSLYVTEDSVKAKVEQPASPKSSKKASKSSPSHVRKASANGIAPPPTPPLSSTNAFNGSPTLNLEMIARSLPKFPEDPLTDEHFAKSHRRAERKEKQLRNIEKERAMHEKVQLDRILEGLQGHDWLKVLGITGITDGEAKKFEAKRDYFIHEVKGLVEKFKLWKEQERRQKVEKGVLIVVKEEYEEEAGEISDEPESGGSSTSGPPSSDLNASAARQLQQETATALKSLATASKSNPKDAKTSSLSPTKQPSLLQLPPDVPMTSFYSKMHLRDAALGKARHAGRKTTAFGHPVPDLLEKEFDLPPELKTEEVVKVHAREKRRRKRQKETEAAA